jgi:hypothetical protein
MKRVVLTAELPDGYVLSNYITAFNQYAMPSGESMEIRITEVTHLTDKEIKKIVAHAVGKQSEKLCSHDNSVTNRICDDCGAIITYVPDELKKQPF